MKSDRSSMWWCKCSCGKEKEISRTGIVSGSSSSCGCVKHELDLIRNRTHGHASSKKSGTYSSYHHMRDRCYNEKHHKYKYYGGKGVKVCDRWLESFENFLEDMGERPEGKTLDRYPNKEGNYERTNCRWATIEQQLQNTTRSIELEYEGTKKTAQEIADIFNVCRSPIYMHLKKGRTIEQIVAFYKRKELLGVKWMKWQ